jgi:hypothetical protein
MVGAGTYVISKKLLIAAWKFLGFGACSVPMPGGPIWLSRAAALRAVLPE